MVSDIAFSSLCEHHLLPFVGVAHVGYLPGRAHRRPLEAAPAWSSTRARRLQVQERLTAEIADWLERALLPRRGAAVVMEATHMCMSLGGCAQPGARTTTSALRGRLRDDPRTHQEFFELIGHRGAPS